MELTCAVEERGEEPERAGDGDPMRRWSPFVAAMLCTERGGGEWPVWHEGGLGLLGAEVIGAEVIEGGAAMEMANVA